MTLECSTYGHFLSSRFASLAFFPARCYKFTAFRGVFVTVGGGGGAWGGGGRGGGGGGGELSCLCTHESVSVY